MAEQFCTVGDIELCYETFGDTAHPALLLTMGLATQMIGWHEQFCSALADRGFHVIRYDNRDVGRSKSVGGPAPTLLQLLRRDKRAAAYTLADMAADGIGLLDHLEIERAHVMGASMGGMIAQTMAAHHHDRVLSLVSMMANTGARWSGEP
jgi:pimeloyl-ACP methyl ester carboxylesterase